MTLEKQTSTIKTIPIDEINILNPRVRNQRKFMDMAGNISKVGLKRPITVTESKSDNTHNKKYELVCGQGRIEAFLACGQKQIPAIVIDASEEQALIMSLVENLARRQHNTIDLLHGIEVLRKQGYNVKTIAEKTGLSVEYSHSVIILLEHGEERLLTAVESRQLPLSLAIKIAKSPDDEQRALQEAYENKELRGKKFLIAKRLLETRKRCGKSLRSGGRSGKSIQRDTNVSADDILKIYKKEVDRKRLTTRKADIVSSRLLFITTAMKQLLQEDNFINLLRAENLITMPKQLSLMIRAKK